ERDDGCERRLADPLLCERRARFHGAHGRPRGLAISRSQRSQILASHARLTRRNVGVTPLRFLVVDGEIIIELFPTQRFRSARSDDVEVENPNALTAGETLYGAPRGRMIMHASMGSRRVVVGVVPFALAAIAGCSADTKPKGNESFASGQGNVA